MSARSALGLCAGGMQMTDPDRFQQRADSLSELLKKRLGIRGKSFPARLGRAKRRLPRAHRADLAQLRQASSLVGHPKLARLVDAVRTEQAFDSITAHLKTIDRAEARRHAMLTWLAVLVFNLLVLGLAVLAFVKWQALP